MPVDLAGGSGTLHFYSDPSTPPPPMNEYPRQTSSRNPFSKEPTKKEGVRKGIFQRVPTKSEVVGICSSTRGVQKKMEVLNQTYMSQCSCTCTCGKVASCNWDSQVVYHFKTFLKNPAEK